EWNPRRCLDEANLLRCVAFPEIAGRSDTQGCSCQPVPPRSYRSDRVHPRPARAGAVSNAGSRVTSLSRCRLVARSKCCKRSCGPTADFARLRRGTTLIISPAASHSILSPGLMLNRSAIDFGTVTWSLLVTLLTSLLYQGHFPCQVFTAVGIEHRPPAETVWRLAFH